MPNSKFEKKSTFEHLADSIEAQIREEGWNGLLPSGRDLANQHKVSLPTIQKAINLLIERQVLVSRGCKRRPEVARGWSGSDQSSGRLEVLVLATKPLAFYDGTVANGIQKLGESLKAKGEGFRFADLSHVQGAERRRAAHAEMVKSSPTHVILMSPDTALFAGVSRHHVKIGSMFGNLRSKRVIRLGLRYNYLVDHAVKQLIPLGHRHFLMPFLDRKVKMTRMCADVIRIAKELGVRIDVKVTSQPLTTENMGRFLGAGLEQGATAVLFPQWTDFMPAIGYFAARGLEYPRDLSVVSLVCLPISRLYVPCVAGFLTLPNSITQQAEDWIYTDQFTDDAFRRVFEKTWDSGASIGPVPKR
jgi:hypothetical protein